MSKKIFYSSREAYLKERRKNLWLIIGFVVLLVVIAIVGLSIRAGNL